MGGLKGESISRLACALDDHCKAHSPQPLEGRQRPKCKSGLWAFHVSLRHRWQTGVMS